MQARLQMQLQLQERIVAIFHLPLFSLLPFGVFNIPCWETVRPKAYRTLSVVHNCLPGGEGLGLLSGG